MSTLRRIAPFFAVRDLEAAMGHYERLGFAVRAVVDPDGNAIRFGSPNPRTTVG